VAGSLTLNVLLLVRLFLERCADVLRRRGVEIAHSTEVNR